MGARHQEGGSGSFKQEEGEADGTLNRKTGGKKPKKDDVIGEKVWPGGRDS